MEPPTEEQTQNYLRHKANRKDLRKFQEDCVPPVTF